MKSRSHRLPAISDTPDDWVDESWTVDCVCGVNFDDGEEMVDCDECGVWVHTRCSRYVKSEKLFACDKCKSKKLRKESEETEVAQLLVELPTKTLRMDKPYPLNCTNQNPFHVWTEVPMEEKVHVQGIPGGDPALFNGVSSIFNSNLWKCTGYVPKKFNYQYREFPCWDNRQDNDNNNNNNDNKIKEEVENHDNNGADALFLLSKENVVIKTEVSVGEGTLDMGPPNTDLKKHDVENHEIRRQQSGIKKERSLVKTIVFHSGNQKKDDSNRKKNVKFMEKEGESKKINHLSSDSVATTLSDAKQSESNKGVKVFKTNKQSGKHENSGKDAQNNHKSDDCYDKNNSQPLGDDSRTNASKEAKQMEENDVNQVISTDQISPEKEDDMASSSLIQNPMETSVSKHEAEHDVDDANDNARSESNETKSNKNSLEKVENGENHAPIEVKSVEINHPKLDSPKTVTQDPNIPSSASVEMKKEAVYVSQKAQKLNKSPKQTDTKPDEPVKCGPTQPKLYVKRSETSTVARSSEARSSGVPNQRKIIVKKPTAPDKPRYSNTDDHKSSGKNNIKIKKDNSNNNNGDVSEKPKKPVKDLPKSSSTSALKSSHLSKSSHVLKKNSSDLKDSAILSSSKTSSAALESGDSANSSRSDNRAHGQNKISSEKTSQLNRQHVQKNHPPHVHPTPSTNAPATLSDEELALLLHQELNSSPRVPRVPRMRHAGSLPQLPSGTSLMKRTSSCVVKDNTVLGSRKKNKDLGKKNEFEGLKRCVSVSYSRRNNDNSKVKKVVDKPTVSTSGPSSSNEAAPQIASDDENGKSTHRTLPGLIAEIMSKGKRMTYEELCNAVLPHWPNLRKHNGERYAYSSHSQAVLDCLRNRSEWSRLVDRGPKTNGGRKRRKSESDAPNLESEEDDYSTDRNTKENEFPKGKRKHRRLALQGRGIKDVRRRRKAEVVSDDDDSSSDSDSSEESVFSDEERKTLGQNEASASSDEMGTS